jgi:hypothetical protein
MSWREETTMRTMRDVFETVKIGGRNQNLMSVVGPGDTPEPVITIGFPADFQGGHDGGRR